MIPTLSQVCSLPASFTQDVEDFAAGHCHSLEVWLTKAEAYVQQYSVTELRRLADRNDMRLSVASFQGGLLTSQGEARREAWQLFEQRLGLCQQLEISTIVVACDTSWPLDQAAIERTQQSLHQVAITAERYGLRAALEFQSRAAFGNNLQTAVALVEQIGHPHLGLCLDWFHFHVGPSKVADLGLLTRNNLFHVQLADVADVPRELASDSDRILPGDGDLDATPLISRLSAIGYTGCVSLELMNPQLWHVGPRQLGEIGMTALRKLLGQAAMSS